jgi:A/G-specific adenine glycosylase
MLHRTQAIQAMHVYQLFVSAYPTLSSFVKADARTAARLLRPLGLHWRGKALVKALRSAWSIYGEVPADPEKLALIPGVGPYIASATVCFTRNRPLPLVDANTVRVLGRIYGLDLTGEARRRSDVIAVIARTCPRSRPRDYYYALIDLAHTICLPRNPLCNECPLATVPCTFAKE